MKNSLVVGLAFLIAGCGGSNKAGIMTPEDRLNAQIAEAEAQREQQDEQLSRYEEAETSEEEAAKFDKESADRELRRASLNAVDCPNTFEKSQLADYAPGQATVSLVFENDGRVKDVSVSSPYDGTSVGDCIERAMGTVHIEPFKGAEVPMTWDLELKEAKPAAGAKPDAKKK